ncbi:MAG: Fis family transcriptional regulator [Gammaproteobacteria bacterium]|nr:Fis family transcriptional regulator [Gammaproteobacteria bacterium]
MEKALENYFRDLDGEEATNLHELVISQVEKPLFRIVLDHHNGNISRTAQALGLNRGTVLGRLKKYGVVP